MSTMSELCADLCAQVNEHARPLVEAEQSHNSQNSSGEDEKDVGELGATPMAQGTLGTLGTQMAQGTLEGDRGRARATYSFLDLLDSYLRFTLLKVSIFTSTSHPFTFSVHSTFWDPQYPSSDRKEQ